jgi:hypothetical protein
VAGGACDRILVHVLTEFPLASTISYAVRLIWYEHMFVMFGMYVQNCEIYATRKHAVLLLGKIAAELHEVLITAEGSDSVTKKTVIEWFQSF